MKYFITILFIFYCQTICFGQVFNTTYWQGADKCSICDKMIVNGETFRIISDDNVYLAFNLTYEDEYYVGMVYLINKGERFDFEPTKQTGVLIWKDSKIFANDHQNYKTYPAVAPETIAQKLQTRALWANALRSFGAGMQTQTSTASVSAPGQFPTQVTITEPSSQAKQTANQQNAQTNARTIAQSSEILGSALRANTLLKDGKIYGNLYFPRKKGKVIAFNLKLRDTFYSFIYNLEK